MTMLDGAAGFPLVNGIPRGEIFVDFLTSSTQSGSTSLVATTGSSLSTVRPTPGGFNDNAGRRTVSEQKTTLPDGTVRTEMTREYDDGSRRTEVWHRYPDGTFTITAERRSLPDASGFEKVRVWTMTKQPDGTKQTDFQVFRVPGGTQPNWEAAGTQQFLIDGWVRTELPDGTILPDLSASPEEGQEIVPDRPVQNSTETPKRKTTVPITV